jgi:hypothetical protein
MALNHRDEKRTRFDRWLPPGARLIVGYFLPVLVAAFTLLVYLGASGAVEVAYGPVAALQVVRDWSAAIGLAGGILAWVVLAKIYSGYANAELANPRQYQKLQAQLRHLQGLMAACDPQVRETAAYREAQCFCDYVSHFLEQRHAHDPRWGLADGYVDLWECLHQAEEALFPILPRPLIVNGALNDVLILGGSDIPDRLALLSALWCAVRKLDPPGVPYVELLRSAEQRTLDARKPDGEPQPTGEEKSDARSALRTVRQAINEYRDVRFDGLVRMRNQSLCTLNLLGGLLYALIVVATLRTVSAEVMSNALLYFLVAATTGVLARLRYSATNEFAVEDFGLSNLRLITRPFTSGLAALLGMLALGLFQYGSVSEMLSISAAELAAYFSPEKLGTGLLLSAVFGLTPEVVFSNYTRVAEMYGKQLKNSRTSEAAATV